MGRRGSNPEGRARVAKGGRHIPVLLTIAPIKDRAGAVIGMSATVVDITRSRAVEEQLKEAGRRKDEFLAMLAHELRNPLAPIRNAVEIQKLATARDSTMVEKARSIIERQVAHLTRLIDDLLDVSRVTQGKIHLERKPLAIQCVLTAAVDIARPLIEARTQQLTVSVANGDIDVYGDFTRLVQAVGNQANA